MKGDWFDAVFESEDVSGPDINSLSTETLTKVYHVNRSPVLEVLKYIGLSLLAIAAIAVTLMMTIHISTQPRAILPSPTPIVEEHKPPVHPEKPLTPVTPNAPQEPKPPVVAVEPETPAEPTPSPDDDFSFDDDFGLEDDYDNSDRYVSTDKDDCLIVSLIKWKIEFLTDTVPKIIDATVKAIESLPKPDCGLLQPACDA